MGRIMDINGFDHSSDFYGFEAGDYKQYPKSNTSFLNFTIEDDATYKALQSKHEANLKALRDLYYPQADAQPNTDMGNVKRAKIFADLEVEIKKENARFEKDIKDLKVALGLEKAKKGLSGLTDALKTLGVGNRGTTAPVVQTTAGNNPPEDNGNMKKVLIVGGVTVALAIIGVIIYKMKK